MGNIQDASVGLKVESVYGTGVTVDRWHEFEPGSLELKFDPTIVEGQGLRVGGLAARADRESVPTKQWGLAWESLLLSKGFGYLLTACFGSGTHTLVSGSTYQQLFRQGTPSSYTVQVGLVEAGGTVDPYTLLGSVVTGWEFTLDNAGVAKLKVEWDCQTVTTVTAYTAPSYPTTSTPYDFSQGLTSAMTIGGALTPPTTTVMASGGTAVLNVRDFKLSWKRDADTDRFTIGNSGLKRLPVFGRSMPTGSLTYEYDSTTIRDAIIANTTQALSLTLTTPTALSTGFEQFQIAIPAAKLRPSGIPSGPDGKMIVQSADFTVKYDGTNDPVYMALRTSDSAL